MHPDAIEELITEIRESSFSTGRWPALLDSITRATDSIGSAIVPLQQREQSIIATDGMAHLAEAYIKDGWYLNDYRNRGIPRLMQTGLFVDQDIIHHDAMRTEPYYQGFLAPLGFQFFAGLHLKSDHDQWCLTLQRGAGSYFDKEDQRSLRRLLEPLNQSVKLERALGDAYASGSTDIITTAGTACLLLDRFLKVRFMNKAAESLLGKVFTIRQNEIRLSSGRRRSDLHDYLDKCARGWRIPASPFAHATEEFSVIFEVVRLPNRFLDTFSNFSVLVVIKPLVAFFELDEALISNIFGLSAREALLVSTLCREFGLSKVADLLNISHETARSQLKSIFLKTRTSSQVELVSLMRCIARNKISRQGRFW